MNPVYNLLNIHFNVILPFKPTSSKSPVSCPLQLHSPAGTIPTFRVPLIDSQYLLYLAHPHTRILSALPAERKKSPTAMHLYTITHYLVTAIL
jgi:hypothetical protein